MRAPMVLRYVVSPTRVGRVLILMSRRGVFDVVLAERGATRGSLVAAVQSRFPQTLLIADDGTHGSWAAAVVARIDGAQPDLVAPIDLAPPAPLGRAQASEPRSYEYAS